MPAAIRRSVKLVLSRTRRQAMSHTVFSSGGVTGVTDIPQAGGAYRRLRSSASGGSGVNGDLTEVLFARCP
jgi:hypothetical protein